MERGDELSELPEADSRIKVRLLFLLVIPTCKLFRGIPVAAKHDVVRVFDGWAARAQRNAVLWRIPGCNPNRFSGPLLARVPLAFEKLRKIWTARLYALRSAGWEKIQDDTQFNYVLNCTAFGCQVKQQRQQQGQEVEQEQPVPLRFCGHTAICPFCWARNVGDCYEAFHYALYGTLDARFRMDKQARKRVYEQPKPYDLIELRRTRWISRFGRINTLEAMVAARAQPVEVFKRGSQVFCGHV